MINGLKSFSLPAQTGKYRRQVECRGKVQSVTLHVQPASPNVTSPDFFQAAGSAIKSVPG